MWEKIRLSFKNNYLNINDTVLCFNTYRRYRAQRRKVTWRLKSMQCGVVCAHRSQPLRYRKRGKFYARQSRRKVITMTLQEKYLTRSEVCKILGISTSTLRRLVDCGDFPQPIQISERRQLFRDNDIFDWLEERDLDRMRAIHDDDTFDDEWDDEDDKDEE